MNAERAEILGAAIFLANFDHVFEKRRQLIARERINRFAFVQQFNCCALKSLCDSDTRADFSILAANYGKIVTPVTDSGSITLVAGQKYSIIVDYYDATGPASINLMWSSPSQSQQTLPKSVLYPS